MTEQQVPQQPPLPPVKVAFILDGKVQDVLHTDDRLAAIFLSEPIMVDVTEVYDAVAKNNPESPYPILIGWDYNGTTITPPEASEE